MMRDITYRLLLPYWVLLWLSCMKFGTRGKGIFKFCVFTNLGEFLRAIYLMKVCGVPENQLRSYIPYGYPSNE